MIMMTGLIEEIRQYVMDRSEAYKRDSEDHYDFWNEHIRYVYKEAMALARKYHADETIVALGALLHDIALIEKAGDRKDHHLNGKILSDQIENLRPVTSSRSITNGLNCANTCLEKVTDEALLEELLKSAPQGFTPMYYEIVAVRSLG